MSINYIVAFGVILIEATIVVFFTLIHLRYPLKTILSQIVICIAMLSIAVFHQYDNIVDSIIVLVCSAVCFFGACYMFKFFTKDPIKLVAKTVLYLSLPIFLINAGILAVIQIWHL